MYVLNNFDFSQIIKFFHFYFFVNSFFHWIHVVFSTHLDSKRKKFNLNCVIRFFFIRIDTKWGRKQYFVQPILLTGNVKIFFVFKPNLPNFHCFSMTKKNFFFLLSLLLTIISIIFWNENSIDLNHKKTTG